MSINNINSISEFLLQAGTEYRIFDLGRTIQLFDAQTFLDIEINKLKVPRPRNGYLWVGCLFWNQQVSEDHYIWFIKLPVDEQCLLISAARNQFLEIVVTALGKTLEHAQAKQAELPDNPYLFKPSEQQMADFNATSNFHLKLLDENCVIPVKRFMEAPSVQDWRALKIQDISNFVACLSSQPDLQQTVSKSLNQLPIPFINALCSGLENIVFGEELAQSIVEQINQAPSEQIKAQWLRALHMQPVNNNSALIDELLNRTKLTIDTLVVIAGRHWASLKEEHRLMKYLNQVAKIDNTFDFFNGIYSDLVQIPMLRQVLLNVLKDQGKPTPLKDAFHHLAFNVHSKGTKQ